MTILNKNTKKAQHFIYAYNYAKCHFLGELYIKPSYRKQAAYDAIKANLSYYEIQTTKVWGNSMIFIIGWLKKNGTLCIKTPYNYYEIK